MAKTQVEKLNELVNPETFAFERGGDYGKGAPAKSTEITTKKMTDSLVAMTKATPAFSTVLSGFNSSYLGEDSIKTKSRREKDTEVLPKAHFDEMEADKQSVPGNVQKQINNLVLVLAELDPGPRVCAVSLFNAKLDVVQAIEIATEKEETASKNIKDSEENNG